MPIRSQEVRHRRCFSGGSGHNRSGQSWLGLLHLVESSLRLLTIHGSLNKANLLENPFYSSLWPCFQNEIPRFAPNLIWFRVSLGMTKTRSCHCEPRIKYGAKQSHLNLLTLIFLTEYL